MLKQKNRIAQTQKLQNAQKKKKGFRSAQPESLKQEDISSIRVSADGRINDQTKIFQTSQHKRSTKVQTVRFNLTNVSV